MITIHLRFDGGSTEEEHDIAHIASDIFQPTLRGLFFILPPWFTTSPEPLLRPQA